MRYVIICALNRNSCQCLEKNFQELVLMHNQEHGLILLLTVYGEAPLNEPTSTSGYSTLMLHLADIQIRKQSTESTNSQKASLRTTYSRNRICIIHPIGSVCYWRFSPGGHYFLQETCFYALLKIGPNIQYHSLLATLLSGFLPHSFIYTSSQRGQIIMWAPYQICHY